MRQFLSRWSQKALLLYPGFTRALNELSIIYINKQAYEQALPLLEKIVELEPDSISAHYNLACLYAKYGKIEKSLRWLRKCVELGFNDWQLLEKDDDLKNIRDSLYYKELINSGIPAPAGDGNDL
jgi:tetratricopeptide (TPR) repeat protein